MGAERNSIETMGIAMVFGQTLKIGCHQKAHLKRRDSELFILPLHRGAILETHRSGVKEAILQAQPMSGLSCTSPVECECCSCPVLMTPATRDEGTLQNATCQRALNFWDRA